MKRRLSNVWMMISVMMFLVPMISLGTAASVLKDVWQGTAFVTKSTMFLFRTP